MWLLSFLFVLTMRKNALHHGLLSIWPRSPERATDCPACEEETECCCLLLLRGVCLMCGECVFSRVCDSRRCWGPPGSRGWQGGMWLAEPNGRAAGWTWRLLLRPWRRRWFLLGCPPPARQQSVSPVKRLIFYYLQINNYIVNIEADQKVLNLLNLLYYD